MAKGCPAMKAAVISWGQSYQKSGITYIPGNLKIKTGGFALFWKVIPNAYRLIRQNFTDNGNVSGEEKLYLLFASQSTAMIYCEVKSPADNELSHLKEIAVVKTDNLFKPLNIEFHYQEFAYDKSAQPIQWNNAYKEDGFTFIPGTVKAPFGTFILIVKTSPGVSPQLVTMIPTGSAEIKPLEDKLFLIPNAGEETTTILKERIPLLNSSDPPMLQVIAVVDNDSINKWKAHL